MDRKTLLEKGFTEEQVTEILNGFHAEKQELEAERNRLSKELETKNAEITELSGYRVQIQELEKEKMTESEKISAMKKEAEDNLNKSKIIYNKAQAKSILVAAGIEDDDILNDITSSDEARTIESATRIANKFTAMRDETAKKTKAELANKDITPPGSNLPPDNNVMTWEKFSNLSAEEQDKFEREHPTEFENL